MAIRPVDWLIAVLTTASLAAHTAYRNQLWGDNVAVADVIVVVVVVCAAIAASWLARPSDAKPKGHPLWVRFLCGVVLFGAAAYWLNKPAIADAIGLSLRQTNVLALGAFVLFCAWLLRRAMPRDRT